MSTSWRYATCETLKRRWGSSEDRGSKGLSLEEVYRQLFNPDLYLRAYGRLYRNEGAMTRGTTEETVDGMSEAKITSIIDRIRHERYRWTPVRREVTVHGLGVVIPRASDVTSLRGYLSYCVGAASRRSTGVGDQCGSGFAMEVGADGFEEELKNRSALLGASGDRRPDPLEPAPSSFAPRALGYVSVDDHEANRLLGQSCWSARCRVS